MKKTVASIINEYMSEYLSEQDCHALEAWNEVKDAVLDSVSGVVVNRNEDGSLIKKKRLEPPVKLDRRFSDLQR